MYRQYNSIVTLMEPDRKSIIKNFGLDEHKVINIPYASGQTIETEFDLLCKELQLICQNASKQKSMVLLGNNPSCINSYILILHMLKQYKGYIEVHCMLNYSLTKDEKYENLILTGRSLFGEDFITDEEFYSNKTEYIRYMNKYDIYICNEQRQTGLGAISTCLRLGKKIYITGRNWAWVTNEYKAIVFRVNQIVEGLSFDEFIKPLSAEEKMKNYQNRVNIKLQYQERWHKYLKMIDNHEKKRKKQN